MAIIIIIIIIVIIAKSNSPGNRQVACRSINQLILSRNTRHWTGHQGMMQPPLTVARKNNVVKTTNEDTKIKNKLIYRKMFKTDIFHKTQQWPFR